MIETALLIGLVVVALGIIGLVLIQQGKGADMGASFGSGASQTLFGSQGSGNFLTKSTWLLAFVFFALCLGLAVIAKDKAVNSGRINFEEAVEVPVTDVEAPAEESEIPSMPMESAEDSDVPVVSEDQASAASDVSVEDESEGAIEQ
ncbi:MAG: preprotein translocase subunit SecG [Pseudomonadales bacterium]|nr:preprotein translocase subunit SecG [Pseudomonadales bacterium]